MIILAHGIRVFSFGLAVSKFLKNLWKTRYLVNIDVDRVEMQHATCGIVDREISVFTARRTRPPRFVLIGHFGLEFFIYFSSDFTPRLFTGLRVRVSKCMCLGERTFRLEEAHQGVEENC